VRIVIPGGSGHVGTILASAFHRDGHDVAVLSRRPEIRAWRVVEWDGATLGAWQLEIDGADVLISSPDAASTAATTPQIDMKSCSRGSHRLARSATPSAALRIHRPSGYRRAPPRSTRIGTRARTTNALGLSAERIRTRRTRGASASKSRARGSGHATRRSRRRRERSCSDPR
jgi:hypothetical protein